MKLKKYSGSKVNHFLQGPLFLPKNGFKLLFLIFHIKKFIKLFQTIINRTLSFKL